MAQQLRLLAALAAPVLLLALIDGAAAGYRYPGGSVPGGRTRVRVRKELRSLLPAEYNLLVTGLSTMLSVPTSTGQALYGKQYKCYEYFIIKHAVAVNDPRGDQGHAGSCFMSFHRAWLLEFELALLSVVPSLGALPYWDLTLDNTPESKYYNTPNFIFSNRWAGALNPDASSGYAVKDGIFAWRQVQKFNWQLYQQYSAIYNGSLSTGLLRSPTSNLNTTFVTRFPTDNLYEQVSDMLPIGNTELPRPANLWHNYMPNDYFRCTDATKYKNWTAWSYCVDLTTVPKEFAKQYINTGAFLHAAVHWAVGSLSNDGSLMGDMFDVATSPNEVLLFFSHHANIDRNNMLWQVSVAKSNPELAGPEAAYGYPATSEEYPYDVDGGYLHDVINANFRFTDIFGPSAIKASGYTHWDVLMNTHPLRNSPYTYDTIATTYSRRNGRSSYSGAAADASAAAGGP